MSITVVHLDIKWNDTHVCTHTVNYKQQKLWSNCCYCIKKSNNYELLYISPQKEIYYNIFDFICLIITLVLRLALKQPIAVILSLNKYK